MSFEGGVLGFELSLALARQIGDLPLEPDHYPIFIMLQCERYYEETGLGRKY
jgi:hypothetical protein